MADDVREQPRVEVERPRCPFCHERVEASASKAACQGCMAWHHDACWSEGGGCGACGAGATATAAPRSTPRAVRRRPGGAEGDDLEGFQDSAPSAVLLHRAGEDRRRTRRSRVLIYGAMVVALVAALAGVGRLMGFDELAPFAFLGVLAVVATSACAAAYGVLWLIVRGVGAAERLATGRRAKAGPGPG